MRDLCWQALAQLGRLIAEFAERQADPHTRDIRDLMKEAWHV